ncbi:SAM-dependent methyltransferase [Allonocardiopsis opalescens]|uniref:S-adenosyl methyltransferase n=1 Tax=Allonocardiopsis opalescens TaxID=1144618 RepID=A0A2T0Q2Q7_9ACTN|nr:SAM-dependent methyltransferase [Allonocardiopsis opalescens]PRX98075.1 S-adenosyl methyltransferase [Allonocardiopsis opalescens]
MGEGTAGGGGAPPTIDTSVSHVARIWNYWLGGKDNYPVDREVGEQILGILPEVAVLARASRALLVRAVTHLAGEAGVRQFLDIGTGLPTQDNTHEVAQRVAPESRVVYVDNDPLVLAHARALLVGSPEGETDYVDADVRDPARVLREASRTLDLDRPVALMLMGIMEFVTDDGQARAVVRELMDALPSGSYLMMYDGTNVVHRERSDAVARQWNASGSTPLVLRSPEQIAGFFDGLELLEPGVVSLTRWRPEPGTGDGPEVDAFCGLGRKP